MNEILSTTLFKEFHLIASEIFTFHLTFSMFQSSY